MEFKSNGKVTLSRQGSHEVADYSINQTGTQLTLSRANGTSSVDHIKSLTSTELIFREEDSEVVDGTACRYVAEFYLRKGKQ
jgi:hypothetical protein